MIVIRDKIRNASNWDELYYILQGDLPTLLPSVQYISYNRYPLWQLAVKEDYGYQDVKLNEIYGDNWANIIEHPPGYPKLGKVTGFLASMIWGDKVIPPIELFMINEEYFALDGNHRIYCHRLLEYKTIRAHVYEVKYNEMLENAMLIKNRITEWLCLGISDDGGDMYHLHDLNDIEENRLKELGVPIAGE